MQNTVNSTAHCAEQTDDKTPVLSPVDMAKLIDSQERQIVQLRRQVAWFERQIFGQKSERHLPMPAGVQGTLGQAFDAIPPDLPPRKKVRIPAYDRQVKPRFSIRGSSRGINRCKFGGQIKCLCTIPQALHPCSLLHR